MPSRRIHSSEPGSRALAAERPAPTAQALAPRSGAKIYYLGGAYVHLLAVGSVEAERRWGDAVRRWRGLFAWAAVATIVALPMVLTVLPASDIGWVYKVNQSLAEEVGWPELVHSVQKVWFSLPRSVLSRAVIFTPDYGEAGAINELGRGSGLPTAVSGQNSEWFWGPGGPHGHDSHCGCARTYRRDELLVVFDPILLACSHCRHDHQSVRTP